MSRRDDSVRTTPTFMDGVFQVANGIPDALLVFRGSTCVLDYVRTTFVRHDLHQGLVPDLGPRRLALTQEPHTVTAMGTEELALDVAEAAAQRISPAVVLLSELPRHVILGENIGFMAEALSRRIGLPCVAAGADGLARGEGDAVTSLLDGLARAVIESTPLPQPRRDTVALLGLLPSRNEGDAQGDVEELERLVAAARAEPLTTWLSGRPFGQLRAALEAEILVGLPRGAGAAARIAEVTGARRLELPLPISIRGTEDWLRALGALTGGDVESWIRRALDIVVPRLDAALPVLRGRRALVAATGDWLDGVTRCLGEDLGISVIPVLRSRNQAARPDGITDPSVANLTEVVDAARNSGGLDLIIGSAWEQTALPPRHRDLPFVEFGFPQKQAHFLRSTPHLGFRGVLTWAERLFDALIRC